VALLALLLAGCGGTEREQAPQPRLPRALATELAARTDLVAARLAAGDRCGAQAAAERLRQTTIAAVNERVVPSRFLEELTSGVNALAASIECRPPDETRGASPPSERDDTDADAAADARRLAEWLRANAR
jgi:hypothetical protein